MATVKSDIPVMSTLREACIVNNYSNIAGSNLSLYYSCFTPRQPLYYTGTVCDMAILSLCSFV